MGKREPFLQYLAGLRREVFPSFYEWNTKRVHGIIRESKILLGEREYHEENTQQITLKCWLLDDRTRAVDCKHIFHKTPKGSGGYIVQEDHLDSQIGHYTGFISPEFLTEENCGRFLRVSAWGTGLEVFNEPAALVDKALNIDPALLDSLISKSVKKVKWSFRWRYIKVWGPLSFLLYLMFFVGEDPYLALIAVATVIVILSWNLVMNWMGWLE